MDGASVFNVICADGKSDQMLMSTSLLNERIEMIKARRRNIYKIHLQFPSWSIEHRRISHQISLEIGIVSDLSSIVAEYSGSIHCKALNAIHYGHDKLFRSEMYGVLDIKRKRVEIPIYPDELFSTLTKVIVDFAYQIAGIQPTNQSRCYLRELIDHKMHDTANQIEITDLFYQILLNMWYLYIPPADVPETD